MNKENNEKQSVNFNDLKEDIKDLLNLLKSEAVKKLSLYDVSEITIFININENKVKVYIIPKSDFKKPIELTF